MNANLKGALANLDKSYKVFEHNGKKMTKEQVKFILEYGIKKGYDSAGDFKAGEIDVILASMDMSLSDLDKVIYTEAGTMSVKEFFKECLREVLVNEPPKRFLGDSGWWHSMASGMARGGITPKGIEPCCDNYCGGESKPCEMVYACTEKEVSHTILALIDML